MRLFGAVSPHPFGYFRSYGTRSGSVFRYSHSKDRPLSSLPALEISALRRISPSSSPHVLSTGEKRTFTGGFFPHLCWEQFLISRMLLLYGHTNVSVKKYTATYFSSERPIYAKLSVSCFIYISIFPSRFPANRAQAMQCAFCVI